MKPCSPSAAAAAPALTRGLALLRLLGDGTPRTLDALVDRTGIPRSSAFRLLESLCAERYLVKEEAGGYRAAWVLQPREDAHAAFGLELERQLTRLRDRCRFTAEWWTPDETGIVLASQLVSAVGEVQVKARPGFRREFSGELECVVTLALAFSKRPPDTGAFSAFVRNGVRRKLPAAEVRARIDSARRTQMCADRCFNDNGVRRLAQAVFSNGVLRGVLALAEPFRFDAPKRNAEAMNLLAEAATRLTGP